MESKNRVIKICPMTQTACKIDECEWWVSEHNECAMLVVAKNFKHKVKVSSVGCYEGTYEPLGSCDNCACPIGVDDQYCPGCGGEVEWR